MIIGITGPYCSGKDTVAEYLAGMSFRHISLSDMIRNELRGKGKTPTRAALIKKGNEYTTAIANLGEQEVRVIITETYRDPSLAGHPSFSSKTMEGFRPYIKDSLLRHELELEEEFGEEDEEEGHPEKDRFYHLVEEESEPSED